MPQPDLYGIVLAGGSARRLSGVDKPMLTVGGVSLLRRVIDALGAAREIVVVGPMRDGIDGADGAVLVDPDGRRQWLAGVWRAGALRDALPTEPANAALHAMLSTLAVTEVRASARQAADVDTDADLRRAREAHGG